MKPKTLLSSKTTARVQIIVVAFSAVSLVIATWIATLCIPRVEKKTGNEDTIISELRYQTTKDLVHGLYAMDLDTDGRINLIDIRLERMMNKGRTKLEELLWKEVLDKSLAQIRRWNSMFAFKEAESTDANLPRVDPNAPIEKTILRVEQALVQARKDAYSRLDTLMHQVNEHELQKAGYENTLKSL